MEVKETKPQSFAVATNGVDVGTISLQYIITTKAKGGVMASIAASMIYCW